MFDKCEICKCKDPDIYCILPIRQVSSGNLDTIACVSCAEKSGAYCTIHQRPHLGFMDGSTACIWCVEHEVRRHKGAALSIRDSIWKVISIDEKEHLRERAEIIANINQETNSVAVLRLVACAALRSHQHINEIVIDIQRTGSANYILGF